MIQRRTLKGGDTGVSAYSCSISRAISQMYEKRRKATCSECGISVDLLEEDAATWDRYCSECRPWRTGLRAKVLKKVFGWEFRFPTSV